MFSDNIGAVDHAVWPKNGPVPARPVERNAGPVLEHYWRSRFPPPLPRPARPAPLSPPLPAVSIPRPPRASDPRRSFASAHAAPPTAMPGPAAMNVASRLGRSGICPCMPRTFASSSTLPRSFPLNVQLSPASSISAACVFEPSRAISSRSMMRRMGESGLPM